ncbi:MAG: DinB family protein [Leptolinea sp.]
MITVLFDLDDTLINNNSDQFIQVYLGLLGKRLQDKIDAKIMIPALLEGTRQMVEKTTLPGTLEETFDKSFYPAIGIEKSQLATEIADFYQNIFPVLQPQTSPRPKAVEIVKACLAKGWQVGIATNPLFPMAAVQHRLHWAGLNAAEIPFVSVTSFEEYHFSKPQPAFFTEVTARIGAFDHPVVMIGNDLKDDILPASRAGLPVFWLTDSADPLPDGLTIGSLSGSMEEIFPWIEKIEKNWISGGSKTIPAILAALRGGAAAIDALVHGLKQDSWDKKPSETEWNITEINCHLRDVDQDVNLPRINTILKDNQPFIAGIETDRWATERDYLHQNGKAALQDFLQSRQNLVQILENADLELWQKVFRHTIFGPSTLKDLMEFTIAHDNNHIKQIMNLIS